MTEPLTKEEDGDVLHEFNAQFRKAVARHSVGRLDLFFRLQFPKAEEHAAAKEDILRRLDMSPTLTRDIPADIAQHPLAESLRARQANLLELASAAMAAAGSERLEMARFRHLTTTMRKLDLVIDRFGAGIAASLADVDELTGLLNRAALDRDLERERAQSRRTGIPFSIAMLDADHFKAVNDDHGHGFGDFVLEELADRFEDSLRPRDRVYRYGGEEFLVILPETPLDQAIHAVERLRTAVCGAPIEEGAVSIVQTVSAGIAEVAVGETAEAGLERADEALYRAKTAGRNRTVASNTAATSDA